MEKSKDKLTKNTYYSVGINRMVFILALIAGWVDTIGISLIFQQRSSSMTGRGHILGFWAYQGNFKMFIAIVLIIISFITGAFISTIIARKQGLTGGLFFAGILIIIGSIPFVIRTPVLYRIFLPMAMGCQNGTTSQTKLSRTTHLTGISTEIGINLAKKNWKTVKFYAYRWIGFPLGSFIGFALADMVGKDKISISITLIIPAIIIMLTAIIQKVTLNIPLLDE